VNALAGPVFADESGGASSRPASRWPHVAEDRQQVYEHFELLIVATSFAGWAALGFPQWKSAVVLGLLCIIGLVIFRWISSRQT
jgi:hypothetical protein